MDVRVGKYMEERPLGHAMVGISGLCNWSECEQLPYNFQQIIGDSYQFVQAEFLFPIVSSWSTQHLTPEAAQGIMFKRGETTGGHLIADNADLSMWKIGAEAHNGFERLFYEAVMSKKLRLLDGITRMPLVELPAEAHARIVELGCVAQSAPDAPAAKVEVLGTNHSGDDDTPLDATGKVYWRVVLFSNIKKIDEHKRTNVRGIIKYLRGLGDKRLPDKGTRDELFWIDDYGSEQKVIKKTVSTASSLARNHP